MEYNLTKNSLCTAFALLDTVVEKPVDIDLTLPDYCPDIERILKCSLIPKVYLSNIGGDRLTVEGGACIRVLYLDSGKGCVRCYEHTVPFSETFPLKDSPEDCAVYVDTKAEYLNCRALSPRKLSLHGAFSLYARVMTAKPLCCRTYEEDGDLQVLCEELNASELSGVCCDMFGVQEDIPLSGRENIAAFIHHRLTARITELKAIRSKIMLTAECRLELMYLTDLDSGEIACMTHAFTVSRVIDCPGVNEDSVIDARLDVMTYDMSLSDDALGGSGVLSLEMKLCFNAQCWNERRISVIGDVFSTEREVEPRYEPLSCRCDVRCLSFTDIAKAAIGLDGEKIGKIIDVHTRRITVSAAISGGAPLLSSKLTVGMLFVNADGEMRWIERDLDFNYNPSADDFDSIDAVRADMDSLSYRIVNDCTVEVRAEVCYHMTVSRTVTRSTLVSVSADEDSRPYDEGEALIICYAGRGERIWDVAKRYHTRPGAILEENALTGGVLEEDTMLLITQ